MKIFKAFALLIAILLTTPIYAENGINSPYTRYGFGQLAAMETSTTKGMGGTGIGVHNSNQINMLNPASYASVDTLTFLLDVGMSLNNTKMTENEAKANLHNATFDYIAIQFRLIPRLGFTLGMTPYSNIGYNFSSTKQELGDEESTLRLTNAHYGTGGLRRINAGLGYTPIKGLSVGANFSYLYGDIAHVVYTQFSDSNIPTTTKQYNAEISTYIAEFGIQYQANVEKHRFTIGAIYQPGHMIDDKPSIIVNSTSQETTQLSIPTKYGIGFSFYYDDRLTAAADYSMEKYSTVEFFGSKGVDRHRASAGVEYIPEHITRNLFRRTRYRAGIHYATAHYTIEGKPGPTEYGATIGVGLPIMNRWNGKNIINISGQYIHLRPHTPGMITESSFRLNIGLSFNETWFDKWRVQ